MIEFIIGASGTGKTTTMFERIKKFQADGKEVCVLVPEQFSNDFDKRLYKYIGAGNFNNLLSLSFSSLARLIFQLYGDPNRNGEYADENARMILIYQAIEQARKNPGALSFFMKKSSQLGFAEEVMKIITDMKHSGITPLDLYEKAEFFSDKLRNKTSDIASIYNEYERIMKKYGFKDNLENISTAAEIANLNRYFKGKCVCLDEFESFNADQIDMIKVIFSSAENVVLTLRTDNLQAGRYTLFETVNSTYNQLTQICRNMNYRTSVHVCDRSYRFKSRDLAYLSENIMRNKPCKPQDAPEVQNISIFEASDMYSEVEYVCAEIKNLIHADKSLKYRDIAVISNSIEQYADVLKASFERYDIPYFLSIERKISHTPIIVFFLTLLDILTARKIHSEQIFRLLKCGILEENFTEISLLENYCYKWEIDGKVWENPFTADDKNLDIIESLRERTLTLLIELRKTLNNMKIKAEKFCQLIYDYLVACNVEHSLGGLMIRLIKSNRDHEASELKRLWSCLINILDSIADTIGEEEKPVSELANIMRSMIGRITYSLIPQTLDEVTAVSARTARLSSPKVIFAIGVTEGDFPNHVKLHGLFSDSDKNRLKEHQIEISRPIIDLIASERLIVYKALSTASHKLYITYPLSDLSGGAKYPAPVIQQIKDMFNKNENKMFLTEDCKEASFYAVTKKSAYYHYMQDRAKRDVHIASIEKVLNMDEDYRKRIKAVNEYSRKINPAKNEPKYKVNTATMELVKDFSPLILSPSQIENYSKCNFKFFCQNCLDLQVNKPVDIDRRITGNLAHKCLQKIFGARTKQELIDISRSEIISDVDKFALEYLNDELGGFFAKTPRFEFFFNKVKEQLVNVLIHTKQELSVTQFIPHSFESSLQTTDKEFTFGDGNILRLTGQIDRTDIWHDGEEKYLRIIDYKSSKKEIDVYHLANGLNLQMLLYMFMATEDGAAYSGYTPAGVLYFPVSISEIKSADVKPKPETDTDKKPELDKALRATGLLVNDKKVLNAMEEGIKGVYIPVSTKTRTSSIISSDKVTELKEFVYGSVVEMAELMYNGNIDANPLVRDKNDTYSKLTCSYCDFCDICGNGNASVCHGTNTEKEEKVKEILPKEEKGKGKKK